MAAKRGLLRGYKALPGTARRVQGPKGETLSHRQYRNVVVRKAGWRSLSELENDEEWAKFRHKIRVNTPGADVSYRSQLVADYVRVKRARERDPRAPELEPAGKDFAGTPLGRILIAAGSAEPDRQWGIDSPKKRPRDEPPEESDELELDEGELSSPSVEELGF